jgi:hypothetical protein
MKKNIEKRAELKTALCYHRQPPDGHGAGTNVDCPFSLSVA